LQNVTAANVTLIGIIAITETSVQLFSPLKI